MSLPDLSGTPLAELAAREAELNDEVRAIRTRQQQLERQVPQAERADVDAEAKAMATGTKAPKATAPDLARELEEVRRANRVHTGAYNIAVAEYGAALTTAGRTWRQQLDTEHEQARKAVEAAVQALAAASDHLTRVRRDRSWLDFAVKRFAERGSIPRHAVHHLPDVDLGNSTRPIDVVLGAISVWADDTEATDATTWQPKREVHWSQLPDEAA